MVDRILLNQLYEAGHTYVSIANTFGVSRQRIHQLIKNYNNHSKRDGREDKYQVANSKCQICRVSEMEALHHIDRNNENDLQENLLSICKKCHYSLHKGEKRESHKLYEWSKLYPKCQECGTTERKHASKGLCINCDGKLRYKSLRSQERI